MTAISKARRPLRIGEIVEATGLSRATIDRVLNRRPGVHRRTQEHVRRVMERLEFGAAQSEHEEPASREAYHFEIVVQAGEAFTETLLDSALRVSKAETSR